MVQLHVKAIPLRYSICRALVIFLEKFTWGGKMEYLNFVGGQGLKLLKLYLFML